MDFIIFVTTFAKETFMFNNAKNVCDV